MRIAYIVETYTDGLGYIDNVLPSALAARGHEVSLITSSLPVYYQDSASHFGSLSHRETDVPTLENGVAFHRLPFRKVAGRGYMPTLGKTLSSLDPDAVLVRALASPVLLQVAAAKHRLGFRLYTSTGQAYSAIPKDLRSASKFSARRATNLVTRSLPGWLSNTQTDMCIGSTDDCVRAAVEFYGVDPSRTRTISLGVDTNRFCPPTTPKLRSRRSDTRKQLGVKEDELLCIWTGRMTHTKSLPLLARAVAELRREGTALRVLFLGSGPAEEELQGSEGTIIRPFVPWKELPRFYQAADFAVWPKSITTSTLDASACGLPVVMCDEETAVERWEGIGATFRADDIDDLKKVLSSMTQSDERARLGRAGSLRMLAEFSWDRIAAEFESVLLRGYSK